jgi:myo-inositol 2-dehydrogenase / D-chiro-inositol 1-dehydrogenase
MVNIGLIGAGRIGRMHARHLARLVPGVRLIAVADVVLAAAQACAAECGAPQAVSDYQELLANPDVDAVVVCSATDTHAQIIVDAAQAGKHIFCEKPIALTLPTIDRALAATDRAGVKLQIGFNRRFDANFARVRAAVARGEIGQPDLLHIISRDPESPPLDYIKVSGGIFLDMMIHDFDMARFLIGAEVEEIYTEAAIRIDPAIAEAGDVDTAVVMVRFTNGVIGTIDNSRRAVYGYDQRVEILGSGGAITTANNYPNTAVVSDQRGVRRDLPLHFFLERYTASYIAEMTAFVEAIRHDQPAAVTGVDGRIPVVLGLAAQQSLQEHRPVRVADIG